MGFLHCLVLLAVEVAEIQRPQNDLVFGDLVKQAVEGDSKFLGYPEAKE